METGFNALAKKLKVDEYSDFNEIFQWFKEDKIDVMEGKIKFVHPSYMKAKYHLLLKGVEGRTQDFIISSQGHHFPLTGFYGLVAKCSNNVKECQLIQETRGRLILNIVKDENYSKKDENLIYNGFRKKFKDEINLTVQYVDQIPLTRGGKNRFLIQKLPIEY